MASSKLRIGVISTANVARQFIAAVAPSQTVAVAAADYWFDTKYKRAYMNNFTTLVPIERTGSLRQSLRPDQFPVRG